MKLHLNHIEICTQNPDRVRELLQAQFQFQLIGIRETPICSQTVLQSGETIFIVTYRKAIKPDSLASPSAEYVFGEPWTNFCCPHAPRCENDKAHIDSVFNIALRVPNLQDTLASMSRVKFEFIQKPTKVGQIKYAIITSICGNVVHTLIEDLASKNKDWFLPGFTPTSAYVENIENSATTYLDHVALACRSGEVNQIIGWYEAAFGMKRFITNREEDIMDGLVIDGDVGMRLKVMEFWKCSEVGLSSCLSDEKGWNAFKLVIAESLPNIKNTQIESFIRDHGGPGLQHLGLHSSNIVQTVKIMCKNGVKFRHPPPTYYTKVGQLDTIMSVGEDVQKLKKYGILLDNEADAYDNEDSINHNDRYLMQVFSHPIFEQDTFFFEVIQRKGAQGFGVGNVTALARSVNAYQEQLRLQEDSKKRLNS